MSSHTPVCELLGIEHPIVEAPLADDPLLPAAVSNAGALGSVSLWWADDAGDLVREMAVLTDRPFAGNFVLRTDQHRRLDQALATGLRIVSFLLGDPESYVEEVHDAGGLVMHTVGSAEEARRAVACGVDIVVAQGWEATGEGVIAHFASGEEVLRYSPAPPMVGTTGEIEALSLWAGQSVALVKQQQSAAEIVAELVSRL